MQTQVEARVGTHAPTNQKQQQQEQSIVVNQVRGEGSDTSRFRCVPDSDTGFSGNAKIEIQNSGSSNIVHIHGEARVEVVNQQINHVHNHTHNYPPQPPHTDTARILAEIQRSNQALRSDLRLYRDELVACKRKVDHLTEELQKAKRQRETPAAELSDKDLVSSPVLAPVVPLPEGFPFGHRRQL